MLKGLFTVVPRFPNFLDFGSSFLLTSNLLLPRFGKVLSGHFIFLDHLTYNFFRCETFPRKYKKLTAKSVFLSAACFQLIYSKRCATSANDSEDFFTKVARVYGVIGRKRALLEKTTCSILFNELSFEHRTDLD